MGLGLGCLQLLREVHRLLHVLRQLGLHLVRVRIRVSPNPNLNPNSNPNPNPNA